MREREREREREEERGEDASLYLSGIIQEAYGVKGPLKDLWKKVC